MATELIISGNFFVLYDNIDEVDIMRYARSDTRYYHKKEEGRDDYFYFKSIFDNQIQSEKFEDIIDNRTGSAFNSISELKEFLDLNIGGSNNPIQVLKYTGWAIYTDSTYTEASPRTINNEVAQITIDSLGSETYEGQLPADAESSLWDSSENKISPILEDDAYTIRVAFTAKMVKNSYFSVYLDIGDGSTIKISGESKISPKTTDAPTDYSFDVPIFARSTFLANGGKMYIDNTDDGSSMDAYDFSILIVRIHKANS